MPSNTGTCRIEYTTLNLHDKSGVHIPVGASKYSYYIDTIESSSIVTLISIESIYRASHWGRHLVSSLSEGIDIVSKSRGRGDTSPRFICQLTGLPHSSTMYL